MANTRKKIRDKNIEVFLSRILKCIQILRQNDMKSEVLCSSVMDIKYTQEDGLGLNSLKLGQI